MDDFDPPEKENQENWINGDGFSFTLALGRGWPAFRLASFSIVLLPLIPLPLSPGTAKQNNKREEIGEREFWRSWEVDYGSLWASIRFRRSHFTGWGRQISLQFGCASLRIKIAEGRWAMTLEAGLSGFLKLESGLSEKLVASDSSRAQFLQKFLVRFEFGSDPVLFRWGSSHSSSPTL